MTQFRVNRRAFRAALAREAFGTDPETAQAAGRCVRCGQPPTFYSEAGRREYRLSGLCEPCFDGITDGAVAAAVEAVPEQ